MESNLVAYLNIDIAIVVVFLAINLAVGFYYGRNVKTIEDYALGGRNFSTAALVSTIVATIATGGVFTTGISRMYEAGLYDLIPACGISLSLILTAYYFVPRMSSFLGSLSIAESMGKYYGGKARFITAVCSIVTNIGAIAVQYKVFGGIVSYFLGIDPIITITASGLIVTFYSAFGGIRSVTFTDILQCMVFSVVIPFVGIIIWKSTFKIPDFSFAPVIQSSNFDIKQIFDVNKIEFWEMAFLFVYFSMPAIFPAFFQRISMGRNIRQVKTAFSISAIILLAIVLLVAWIGFLVFSIEPNLTSQEIIPFIVNNHTFPGFKGLLIIGIMAMAMSSADSFINVASVIFAHDICKPLNIKIKDELKLTKIVAVIIGVGSILLTFSSKNLFQLILFVNAFYMPIVIIPLMFTIWGLQTTAKSVLNGMGAGFLTVVVWKINGIDFDPIVPAMFMNMIVLLGTHYLHEQPGGWVNTKLDDPDHVERKAYKLPRVKLDLTNLVKKYSANETTYSLFGVFCFITTLSTIYLTQDRLFDKYAGVLDIVHIIMLITSSTFMLYMMWSPRLKHPVAVCFAWNFALTYILSFCSSFFLLLSNFDNVQLAMFTLNIMILLNLCRWKTVLYMIGIGFSCSYILFQYIDIQSTNIELNYNNILYMLLFFVSALLMIVKPKQEEIEATEMKVDGLEGEVGSLNVKITDLNEVVTHYDMRVQDQMIEIERLGATAQKILNNVNHELRLPVGNVMNFAEMLSEGLEKFDKEHLKMLSDEVFKNSTRLSTMILNMLDLATLDVKKIDLQKKNINLSELVEDRVNHCRKIYLEQKPIKFELDLIENMPVFVDPNYMRQVIDNLIINAINYSQEGIIKISVQPIRDKNIVEIIIQDQGIGIPRNELFDIFKPFNMGAKTESKAQGRGVGLALCKSAIQAHSGTIEVESNGVKGALFRIRLASV